MKLKKKKATTTNSHTEKKSWQNKSEDTGKLKSKQGIMGSRSRRVRE